MGPLVNKVVLSVYTTEAGMSGALTGGSIQASEWSFSTGAYASLGTNANILEGSTVTYSWFGMAFNTVKFPGNSVNFRRAIQFLQDYTYIQSTVLNGVEGTASPDVLPCAAYGASVCNPVPIATYYGFSTTQAGQELEQVPGLFCNNGATDPCAGSYSSGSTWCTVNYCNLGGTPFAPNLFYRTTHHRTPWGLRTIFEASQIGLVLTGHSVGGGGALANCFTPNQLEVLTPGAYNSITNYNSNPTLNATAIAADNCDILTFGFIAGPAFNGDLQEYSAQFAGQTTNTQNIYDDPTFVTPADPVCNGGGCPLTTHTTVMNLDYDTNNVFYAATQAQAATAAQAFAGAYAIQLPTVMGYFENTLYADNANGWTNFANVPIQGPNELGGAFYTLFNVQQCGTATCTLGAVNGGTLGGTFNYALQQVGDQSGLNVAYSPNWVWAADVNQMIYDTPLGTPPTQFNVVNAFFDYMTTSHVVSAATPGLVTGQGGSWYYFQQPCSPLHGPLICPSRAFEIPAGNQHGAGLTLAQRTIALGQTVTLTFRNDIYFFDGIRVVPKDYVFSLDLLNIAASPNYPDNNSPFSGIMGGSSGLIAAHTVGQTVTLYLGSASFWNIGNIVVPMLPEHLYKNYNPDHFSTAAFGTVDVTQPWAFTSAFSTQGVPVPPGGVNNGIWWLNNMMIGSSGFYLDSWNTPTGTGDIVANPFYFFANWQAMATVNPQPGATYAWSSTLSRPIYNPTGLPVTCGPANPGPIAPGTTGLCGINTFLVGGGKLKVYDSLNNLVRRVVISKNVVTGQALATIQLGCATINNIAGACDVLHTALAPGNYKVVLTTPYIFHGLRYWNQIFGFSH